MIMKTTRNASLGILLAAAAAILALPTAAWSQALGLKIGVIDTPRLLTESPQGKAVNRRLEDEFAPRKRDLQSKQADFKARQDKLQKDGAVMGADERRNAEEKLQKDGRELERRVNEFQEDVQLKQREEFQKLQVELVNEVRNFAKQKGYDLILTDGVIYASPSMDVTKPILDALDASFKAKTGGKN